MRVSQVDILCKDYLSQVSFLVVKRKPANVNAALGRIHTGWFSQPVAKCKSSLVRIQIEHENILYSAISYILKTWMRVLQVRSKYRLYKSALTSFVSGCEN